MRKTDWAALADVQFILYNRVANQLNEAISGIALSDMPEAQDKPPGYWKDHATNRVLNVLNLFTAWTWLIRYKMGEPVPERAIRPFYTNALLAWVGAQLQLSPPPSTILNPLLRANQETLQESLLLLHSVAYTQGSGVRLAFEATRLGTWFRIRFDRSKDLPDSVDDLLTSFGDHWRARDTVFELTTARDFVALNGCELALNRMPDGGEFAFFVRAEGVEKQKAAVAQKPVQKPGETRPLDPVRVAPTGEKPAEAESKVPAESEMESDATPVIYEEQAPTPLSSPTLSVLHPLPPQLMVSKPGAKSGLPASQPPDDPWEDAAGGDADDGSEVVPGGAAVAGEPGRAPVSKQAAEAPKAGESVAGPEEDTGPDAGNKPGSLRRLTVKPAPTVPVTGTAPPPPDRAPEGKPAPDPETGPVIVRVKLPKPQPPERLHTPPAATSNVVLPRETQTLTPVNVTPDAPAEDQESESAQPDLPSQDAPANTGKEST